MHIINGYGLIVIGTSLGNLYVLKITPVSNDYEIEMVDSVCLGRNIVNIYSDVKLSGVGKNTNCMFCKLIVYC